jgi:hypothetical protein
MTRPRIRQLGFCATYPNYNSLLVRILIGIHLPDSIHFRMHAQGPYFISNVIVSLRNNILSGHYYASMTERPARLLRLFDGKIYRLDQFDHFYFKIA